MLTLASAMLVPAAVIGCLAAICMQMRRRRRAQRAAAAGTKRTLEGLAQRNAAMASAQELEVRTQRA